MRTCKAAQYYQLIPSDVKASQQSHVTHARMLVNIALGWLREQPRQRTDSVVESRSFLPLSAACLKVISGRDRDAFLRQRLAISWRVVDQNRRWLGEVKGVGDKSNPS